MVKKSSKRISILFVIFALLLMTIGGCFFVLESNGSKVLAENINSSFSEIFTDYTETDLKSQYYDLDILGSMLQSEEISNSDYDRAVDILNGDVKYTSLREFSTANEDKNKIPQIGDITNYSKNTLKMNWKASDLIVTGIYGLTNDKIKIFVQSSSTQLPYVVFTQNHGYYYDAAWRQKIQLKVGLNEFEYYDFVKNCSDIDRNERKGGAIYLCNPYTESQGKVDVYIDGGGYYPVYKQGEDESEFLGKLAEYETKRKQSSVILDMAELICDHALFTVRSSTLYKAYIDGYLNNVYLDSQNSVLYNYKPLSPNENLKLWSEYMTKVFEFNGIACSTESEFSNRYNVNNDYVTINFRFMTPYSASGAYAYNYHIGYFNNEDFWFANYSDPVNLTAGSRIDDYGLFGIGHELGHMIDVTGRNVDETTNNVTASFAYFQVLDRPQIEQYQPFTKTIKALSNDYTLDYKAYDEGRILYLSDGYLNSILHDHNYLIWWNLDAIFPNFWAKLNDYFRYQPTTKLSDTQEKFVYYSSLATGVDLTDYYDRWGFFYSSSKTNNWNIRFKKDNTSDEFKNLMQSATTEGKIHKTFDHFWYVDTLQYKFLMSHLDEENKDYLNCKPEISKIIKSSGSGTILISGNRSNSHLGYEVYATVGGKTSLVGFTYSSSFVDTNNYNGETPLYKVVAINRFFRPSEKSTEKSVTDTQSSGFVCKTAEKSYDDLDTALSEIGNGGVISLLADCELSKTHSINQLTLQIDSSVNTDIRISVNGGFLQLLSAANLNVIGKPNSNIIFDGNTILSTNPLVYATSGEPKITLNYVLFQNLRSKYLAGAMYVPVAELNFASTSFDNCIASNNAPLIYCTSTAKIDNCQFKNCDESLYLKDLGGLTLANQNSEISISFDDFTEEKNISVINCTAKVLDFIKLVKNGYSLLFYSSYISVKPAKFTLQFEYNGSSFSFTQKSSSFVFGSEGHDYNLQGNYYLCYTEKVSGKEYSVGDRLTLLGDMTFSVSVKENLTLKLILKTTTLNLNFAQNYMYYLPQFDSLGNEIVGYKNVDDMFYAGTGFKIEKAETLSAIYKGFLCYRYIVENEIYSVGYGSFGEKITLPKLPQSNYSWQCGEDVLEDNFTLKSDVDLIAVPYAEGVYNLSLCTIELDLPQYEFTGTQIVPIVKVKYGEIVLQPSYYSVEIKNNINVSNLAEIKILAVQNLSIGSKSVYFSIVPKKLEKNSVNVTGFVESFVYNGTQTSQNLVVKLYQTELKQNVDYRVSYSGDRVNANPNNSVILTIEFMGNYSGKLEYSYNILKAEGKATAHIDSFVYGQTPSSVVVVSSTNPTTDFEVFYRKSGIGEFSKTQPVNAGTYDVKVVLKESQNYNKCEAFTTLLISKATLKSLGPIYFSTNAKTLNDIALPENFEWVEKTKEITMEQFSARAKYIGFDKDNYTSTEIEIELILDKPDANLVDSDGGVNLLWFMFGIPLGGIVIVCVCWLIFRKKRI